MVQDDGMIGDRGRNPRRVPGALAVLPGKRRSRLAVVALVVVALSGCSGSTSKETIASDTIQETTSTTVASTALASPTMTVTLKANRTEVSRGGTIRVTGTGCINPNGDGTLGTVVFGIGFDLSHYNTSGEETGDGTVAADGSFTATVPIDDLTPPGVQQLDVACMGPVRPDIQTCNCVDTTANLIAAGRAFSAISPPIPITVTGAAPLTVSATTVNASQTVRVGGRCEDPGSDYEQFGAWITPIGPTVPALHSGPDVPAADCGSGTAEVDLSVSGLSPGTYEVHALTRNELDPVVRWFQPVEIEVVAS